MVLDKVKEHAAANGMKLLDVSVLSGVPYTALKEWNQHMPSALSLAKVAKVLGTTSEELLKED